MPRKSSHDQSERESRSLRILHVVVAGEIGGAERMLVDLTRSSDNPHVAHEIALFTPNQALRRFFTNVHIPLFDRGVAGEGIGRTLLRSFGRRDVAWLAGCAADFDCLHLHTFGSHLLGSRAARLAGKPFVRTEHSTRIYDDWSCWPISAPSLRRAARVIAVSQSIASLAAARLPSVIPRLSVIPNGVDLSRFPFLPSAPKNLPFTFAIAARLEPRKGIDLALRALAEVPAARLLVCGEGAEQTRLESLTKRLGLASRVEFLGYVAEPREVFAKAHAALAPSRKEGLGIANLEAMATGRPVVAFATGGIPEIVQDEKTGLLAKEQTPFSLAQAMRRLMSDPELRDRLGAAGRALVVERFTIEAVARGYRAVYRDVVHATEQRKSIDGV